VIVEGVFIRKVHNRVEALYVHLLEVCRQANFPAALANMNNPVFFNNLRETLSQPIFKRTFCMRIGYQSRRRQGYDGVANLLIGSLQVLSHSKRC
jgi:hypothetical protein